MFVKLQFHAETSSGSFWHSYLTPSNSRSISNVLWYGIINTSWVNGNDGITSASWISGNDVSFPTPYPVPASLSDKDCWKTN